MNVEVPKVSRAALDKVKPKQEGIGESLTFSNLMADRRTELDTDKLNQKIQDIEDQGKVLSQSLNIEDLRTYKQMVKDFMQDAVKHGLKLEERRGFNRRGRTKVYKIVTEVDKKLLDLTDAVLQKQEKSLKVLDLVGEIKGLLLNVYA